MKGAFTAYRVMAYVTGVVLAVAFVWFLAGRLFLDYSNPESRPTLYGLMWIAHGWLYMAYIITGVNLAFKVRYSILKTIGILIAGTIPFMSFVSEYFVHKDLRARHLLDS